MLLVLCESDDQAALWAGEGLLDRGLPVELVTADDLAQAVRWKHRLGSAGTASEVVLGDGRVLDSTGVTGTLNRLVTTPPWQLAAASEVDREYAAQEVFSLWLSWLWSLPGPMLNRPTPQGLSGCWRHDSEWAVLAAQAGLRTPTYQMTSSEPNGRQLVPDGELDEERVATSFVVGRRVVAGPQQAGIAEGCRRLATASRTALLGVDLIEHQLGGWTFLQASPTPELRLGGDAILDALAAELRAP